jgi:hypothetical protein
MDDSMYSIGVIEQHDVPIFEHLYGPNQHYPKTTGLYLDPVVAICSILIS